MASLMSDDATDGMKVVGPRHWDDLLHREFVNESDRACVILGAALLDSALETVLRSYFIACSTATDPLFEGSNAPLGTFSARIEIAYRAGLMDANFARNLHLVRKIRNDFAHNLTGCTFADSGVVSRLSELTRSTGLVDALLEYRKSNFPEGPRGDFQIAVSWLQWSLRSQAEHIRVIEYAADFLQGKFIGRVREADAIGDDDEAR